MAGRVVSEYVVRLRDEVSSGSKSAGAALKGLGQEAKALGRIGGYKSALRGLRPLANEYRRTQQEVKRLALEMNASGSATAKMKREFDQAARAARKAKEAYRDQQNTIRSNASALRSAGVNVRNLASAENQLRASIERTNVAMRKQEATAKRRAARRQELGHAGNMLAMGAGYGILRQSKKAVEVSAERSHERQRMRSSGMTSQEIVQAEVEAKKIAGEVKLLSTTEVMHMVRNTRSVVGDMTEALHISEEVAKMRAAVQATHPERDMAEDFDQLIKGLEIKGVTQDLPKFKEYIQGMTKALNVFGDTLKPHEYYEMFKYGRQATLGLSQDFMMGVAPTLAQEMGGSSAGTAFSGFNQALVGGKIKQKELANYEKMGLVDPTKIIKTKTGATKGVLPGGIVGSDLAYSDPYRWVHEIFLPALAKQGITEQDDILKAIPTFFGNRMAAQLVGIMATQGKRIEKDRALINKSQGTEAAADAVKNDPRAAWLAFQKSIEDLYVTMGGPTMATITGGLNSLSDGARAFGKALEATGLGPAAGTAATVGGGLLVAKSMVNFSKLLTGGGSAAALTGSAAALDLSAAALTRAAVTLGGGGAIGASGRVAGAAGAAGAVGAVGAAAGGATKKGSLLVRGGGTLLRTAGWVGALVALADAAGGAADALGLLPGAAKNVEGWQKLYTIGTPGKVDAPELRKMNERIEQEEAAKTPEQRAAEEESSREIARQAAIKRTADNREKINRLQEILDSRKADVDSGKLNPQIYKQVKNSLEQQLRRLRSETPEEQGPPSPTSFRRDGAPLPPPRPTDVDASGMNAGAAKAQETGKTMQDALSVTGKPIVDTSSLDQAQAKADRLKSTLTSINSMSAGIGSSVRNVHADTGFGTP